MGNSGGLSTPVEGPQGHRVRVAATELLNKFGITAYHSSVCVDDREYYFDSFGILTAPALHSHHINRAQRKSQLKTEVAEVGISHHSGAALVRALQRFFEKGSYDVLFKNCNSFSDCALYFLTGTRLDGRFSRVERLMTATSPVSTAMMNQLFRAYLEHNTGRRVEVDVYVTNPLCQDFSVQDVIAYIDDAQEESASTEGSTTEEVRSTRCSEGIDGYCGPYDCCSKGRPPPQPVPAERSRERRTL